MREDGKIRVFLLDDHEVVRRGVHELLSGEDGIEVVGEAGTVADALVRIPATRPDVAVLDVRLPPGFRDEGLRAAIAARKEIPGMPILVLSQYVEETYAAELLADGAGGIGYLLKDRVGRVEEFLDALRRVAAGGTALDPEVVSQLMTSRHDPLRALTPREREVLGLMAQGLDNATIAVTLVVTERSVSKHIGAVFAKLGLPPSDSGHRRVLAVLAYLNS